MTFEQFKQISAVDTEELYVSLITNMKKYGIDTTLRISHFLGQLAHESGNFAVIKENLNYSKDGLLKVFPKYFNVTNVDTYARQPEKIANRVYANRIGNGDEASGDGWKYRGRGYIQLTGKANYNKFGLLTKLDLVQKPELIEVVDNAVVVACLFWQTNNLNRFADADDIINITKRINGGVNGLDDRKTKVNNIKKILGYTNGTN